ncbi:hypothetical protein BDV98DRAFT_310760 [Pterulicium gracile]|uniref:Uncharacterized protein n=1 Tax=Pterulicium gracile TaxID=1884261 RepID=A0A5C3Q5X1_9AGAR|nr:hypothetical protein BDV98DRAFT_310760 [Pterula gracilis]
MRARLMMMGLRLNRRGRSSCLSTPLSSSAMPGHTNPFAPVILSQLRYLRAHTTNSRQLFKVLRAPKLRSLDTGDSFPRDNDELTSCVRETGSTSSITSLTIAISLLTPGYMDPEITVAKPDAVGALCLLFPFLQILRVHGVGSDFSKQHASSIALLESLTWPAPDTEVVQGSEGKTARVCPALAELHCFTDWRTVEDIPWELLRNLVESRIGLTGSGQEETVGELNSTTEDLNRRSWTHGSPLRLLAVANLPRDTADEVKERMGEDDPVLEHLNPTAMDALLWLFRSSGLVELRI